MGTKTAKNKPVQTSTDDQIQSRMVRKKIRTNQSILSFQPNMQHLRIQIRRFNTRNAQMDLSTLWNNTPQRHQRSKKHTKRRNKINILKKGKILYNRTRRTTGDSLVNSYTHKSITAQEYFYKNGTNIK